MRRLALLLRQLGRNANAFRLENARPDGVNVASYGGKDVSDVVIDDQGYRYILVGLAPRKADGTYDMRLLKTGEVILEPGLLYQLIPVKARWIG